ncbi:MAG: site-specific integrase [Alphaproteobacteria bacterium]|nr:site-specific integrase [Alphaproteobacteria bacterium]MBL7097325.1 site-specific integrase [Alphaproteobacteria bacterium]
MTARRIRQSWWVDLRFDHRRYRKRSPENSRTGAIAYEATLRHKLARGEDIDGRNASTTRVSFAEFVPKWFAEYVVPNNKPSEQKAKKYALSASLVPSFGRMLVSDIGVRDVEQYKAKLVREGKSHKTINNRLTILRKCLHTAYDWLALPGAPPKIVWLKCPPARTHYLATEECNLLVEHSSGIVREMIVAALRTGMRQGELKGLQWTSIDWLNRSVAVRHSRSDDTKALGTPKGNRERHIPLDIDLCEMLSARRRAEGYVFLDNNGQPFTHKKASAALAAVCRHAGLPKVGWHTLRHTFASHLAMNGTPLNIVQALLGHASITTTMRYAHVAPSALRTAIELANPRTAGVAADNGQPAGNRWQLRRLQNASAIGEVNGNPTIAHGFPASSLPLAAECAVEVEGIETAAPCEVRYRKWQADA